MSNLIQKALAIGLMGVVAGLAGCVSNKTPPQDDPAPSTDCSGLIDEISGDEPTLPGAYIKSIYGPDAGRTAILDLTAIAPSLESVILSGNNEVIFEDNSLGQQPEPVSYAGYFQVITKTEPETVTYTFQVTGRDGTIYRSDEVVSFSGNLEDRIPRHNVSLYGPLTSFGSADVNFYACDTHDNAAVEQLSIYKNNERIFYADAITNPSGDFDLGVPEEGVSIRGKGIGGNPQGWIHIKKQQDGTDVFRIEYVDRGNHRVGDSVKIVWPPFRNWLVPVLPRRQE